MRGSFFRLVVGLAILFLSGKGISDPGFYPPDATQIPAAVAASAKRTFRLILQAEHTFAFVPPEFNGRLREGLAANPFRFLHEIKMIPDGMLAKLILHDLDRLKPRQALELKDAGIGSAFFLKSGLLISARHVLDGGKLPEGFYKAKSASEARDFLKSWKGRLVLIDSEGKIVFDTSIPGQKIKEVVFSGHPAEIEKLPAEYRKIEISAKGQMVDLVAWRLEGLDTKDYEMEWAEEAMKVGERLYAAGYPFPTLGRQSNSDGKSLRVSFGSVLPGAPEDYQKFLKTLMSDDETRKKYESSLVFSNADFVVGLSGGPCLRADGKVVSLAGTVRHNPKVSNARVYSVTASYGPDFRLLMPLIDDRSK